jgi:DNA-binding transcriptional ArsR family regulator
MNQDSQDDAPLWNALSHSKRRQILHLLRENPLTTSQICEQFDVSRFAVMKHLTVLEEADLIRVHREGRNRWNVLNGPLLERLEAQARHDLMGSDTGHEPASEATGQADPAPYPQRLTLREEITVALPPERVYAALTREIDRWWRHRSRPGSSRMVLENRLSGRFYEATEPPGGVLCGTVTGLRPGRALWLSGPLFGDRQPLYSHLRIELEAVDVGTCVRITHLLAEVGESDGAEFYGRRWRETLQALKVYVEREPGRQEVGVT